jgi:hypothetical protein
MTLSSHTYSSPSELMSERAQREMRRHLGKMTRFQCGSHVSATRTCLPLLPFYDTVPPRLSYRTRILTGWQIFRLTPRPPGSQRYASPEAWPILTSARHSSRSATVLSMPLRLRPISNRERYRHSCSIKFRPNFANMAPVIDSKTCSLHDHTTARSPDGCFTIQIVETYSILEEDAAIHSSGWVRAPSISSASRMPDHNPAVINNSESPPVDLGHDLKKSVVPERRSGMNMTAASDAKRTPTGASAEAVRGYENAEGEQHDMLFG